MCQVESCGCTVEWRQLSHDCKRAKAWYSFIYYSCWVWVYFYIQYNGPSFGSETLIKRQATQHDCLPCWLGDGDKWSEIVSCEEKSVVLGRLVQSQCGGTNISCTYKPNTATNDGLLSCTVFSLSPHLPLFQQSAENTPLQSLGFGYIINAAMLPIYNNAFGTAVVSWLWLM